MTLYPGDLILSGAADVAPIAVGDAMALEIPGIGTLATVVSASAKARSKPW
jgi:2-keto-4-pentenoate hydratase/2-oxohepta-3-ene-1,7-dioic acid hydratase in catechol pathway